jgi:ABC-type lipoprotein export system ATPase subunit
MNTAIEMRDVFRVYTTGEGDAAALQGITLSVRRGEIVTVLGPSGSGKTTLLRILAGLERPSAGEVRVFGSDLRSARGRELARYRTTTLGYLDQHYTRALESALTVGELVELRLRARGLRREERRTRADELLEAVGLLERREARPPDLSGGELSAPRLRTSRTSSSLTSRPGNSTRPTRMPCMRRCADSSPRAAARRSS